MVREELKSFDEKAPSGWEGTVKALKKHGDEVDNPWALAHWMKKKGYKSHKESINEAKTVSIDGEELMNFLMKRFKYSKKKAIDVMKKHNMDLSFLKKESDLPITTKKGKTIKVRHKKSQ